MLVFVSLFVCGGTNPLGDVQRFCSTFQAEKTALIVVGSCNVSAAAKNTTVYRVLDSKPSTGNGHFRYAHIHNKFKVWGLPYDRVAFYDLDVTVKPPVARCAALCAPQCAICAVRDPYATWPRKVKTYFNGGFFVATPSKQEYTKLRALSTDGRTFAEQDVLNDYFAHRWCKLPKYCNWLNYKQTHPGALTDPSVWMVHTQRQF